jgi:arylsulfatase A-like enzyme
VKPNFVVLLIDDAAFMDLGIYGGEARTPNIDALASGGAMFTRYYTSPLCSPSRAMLLTGMDNHLTGVSTIPEVLPKEHEGQPGYTMRLEPGVATLADQLKSLGYRSIFLGKWHLGGAGQGPLTRGFDAAIAGSANPGPESPDDDGTDTRGAPGTDVLTRVERPRMYKCLFHNDDYTSMEFVTEVLMTVFRKTRVEAHRIMLSIHNGGRGVAGVYTKEIAETKATAEGEKTEEKKPAE